MKNPKLFWVGCLLLCSFAIPGGAQAASSGGDSYVVTWDIPTLSEISTFLYGTCKMSGKIAQWNHLSTADRLRVGQELRLEVPPRVTAEQGNQALLAMWRKHFQLPDESERLPASVKSAPDRAPASASKKTTPSAPAQKPVEAQDPVESPVLF